MQPDQVPQNVEADGAVVSGNCDGLDGRELYGWAWRPAAPQERVHIEQWVDGRLAARTIADRPRPDLETAGVGDGAYGWRMPLALDPGHPEPQSVEVRVAGGELLPNGALQLSYTQVAAVAALGEGGAWGVCDSRAGDTVTGWAWRAEFPETHVEIEQWVDGVLVGRTVADEVRPDLHAAGIGLGRYGWTVRLALDPAKDEPQEVELRIRGDGLLAHFVLRRDELPEPAPKPEAGPGGEIVGRCDGLKGSALHGWAWNPATPDEPVEVELWIDGVRRATCLADRFRADLTGRVGRGRHAWRFPVELPEGRTETRQVEVRAKDGPPLEGGVITLGNDVLLDDPRNVALRSFVGSVLAPAPKTAQAAEGGQTVCLLYCPEPTQAGRLWACEYDDYRGAMRAFAPALARLGEAMEVESSAAADAIWAERRAAGQHCVLFSFGPPRRAPLTGRCPVIPVFGWGFPNLPTASWDGDLRSDWRNALRLTGRAVTFSQFAAAAVKAAMGADFPVAAIPPPVVVPPEAEAPPPPAPRRALRVHGVVFDSREHQFDPNDTAAPQRVWRGDSDADRAPQTLDIEGVLFTAVLDFEDGRKNWGELVAAFVTAHRDTRDAVLLLRLAAPDAGWPSQLYRWLALLPRFACRVLAVRAPLEPAAMDELVAATDWCVSVANAEGLGLPLQRFLAAGRPAIAPAHTALADLIAPEHAVVVASEEEPWRWPEEGMDEGWSWTQHPDDVGPTTRHRLSWPGLVDALAEGYRISRGAPSRYSEMAAAARRRMREACSEAAAEAVAALLAAPVLTGAPGPNPSGLIRDLADA
jgi:hypothetical protein